MNMKKVIAVVSAAVMLVSSVTVNAKTIILGKVVQSPFTELNANLAAGTYDIAGTDATYQIKYNGTSNGGASAKIAINNGTSGTNCLYMDAKDNRGGNGGATFIVSFGELTGDGTYTVQFDMARKFTDWEDHVSLNLDGWNSSSRLDSGSKWTKSDAITPSAGSLTWKTYTATYITAIDPSLYFGAFGWGTMHIDNIIVTDSNGTVVFSEDFEEFNPDDLLPDYEYLDYGLYADGEEAEVIEGEKTYTAKVSIVNNKISAGIDAQIFAVLRKNGEAVDIKGSDLVTVEKDKTNQDGIEISTTIDVGDVSDGEYEISVYLWDGLETMKILTPSKQYRE